MASCSVMATRSARPPFPPWSLKLAASPWISRPSMSFWTVVLAALLGPPPCPALSLLVGHQALPGRSIWALPWLLISSALQLCSPLQNSPVPCSSPARRPPPRPPPSVPPSLHLWTVIQFIRSYSLEALWEGELSVLFLASLCYHSCVFVPHVSFQFDLNCSLLVS